MLLLAACFALGIAGAGYLPVGTVILFASSVALAFAALLFRGSRFSTLFIFAAFVVGGAFAQTASQGSISPNRLSRLYDDGGLSVDSSAELTGVVAGSPESAPEGLFIRVDVDSVIRDIAPSPASGRIRVFAPTPTSEIAEIYRMLGLQDGTRVRFSCELKRHDEFRNPGGLSRRKVLEWQGLDATCTLSNPYSFGVLGQPGGLRLISSVYAARETLIAKFRDLFNPHIAGVMIASLLGNKHFLDKNTADIFREGGTFHILVISGLHITFIGGLAAWFVGLFTKRRLARFVIVCTFLWLYTIAVGSETPVVRASLMFTVLWFSYVTYRSSSPANALGACGLILLAWRPNDLFSPSFQLTFVSVGAIVIAGFPLIKTLRGIGTWTPTREHPFPANVPGWLRRFCETLYWNEKSWEIESARDVWSANLFKSPAGIISSGSLLQKTLAYVFEGIVVSAIVQAAMLPLVVHYFHRVTPASIPLNLWTGILIALESFASLFAVAFSYFSDALALPLIKLTEFFHWLMVAPARFLDDGWLSFRVPIYSGLEFELYAAYLVFAAFAGFGAFVWDPFGVGGKSTLFNRTNVTAACIAAALIGAVIVFHPFSAPGPDGRLHVEFTDVGQGDSALITFPNGETMLIDGGGRRSFDDDDATGFEPDVPSIGETVVSEFLWEKGYSSLDRIVATHADADHIQGLSDVARNFAVGEAWLGSIESDDVDQRALMTALSTRGTSVRTVGRGEKFEIGGVAIEVLNPGPSVFVTTPENDRSIVLRITFGESSFLLTGDIERSAESEILSGFGISSDVVKVPHHGSKTSSSEAFVSAAKAQFVVIPVGRKSPYHHPNKDVVERWLNAGAMVMTTGEFGTIRFSSDGRELSVATFVPK